MSTKEIYPHPAQAERHAGRRFALITAACIVLAFGSLVGGLYAAFHGKLRGRSAPRSTYAAPPIESATPSTEAVVSTAAWSIRGALTEACTCSVPCTCNFGSGPSPHSYCYAFYSYEIRKGNYNDVSLDGLHFGAADLPTGRTIFIDERASEKQREALRLIAMRVIVRVSATDAESKAKELMPRIRYAAIKQEFDERRNRLEVAGIGEFSADYIMGLDRSQPVVVRNNTTWRIRDAIKARTSIYRIKVGNDVIDTKDTNSNQGDYEYTDKTDFGSPARWNCGACANEKAQVKDSSSGGDVPMCGQ